jgi:hypothetical protein
LKRGRGVKHVGIFVGTISTFCFSEISLGIKLGPHGKVDRNCAFVLGIHTHKED